MPAADAAIRRVFLPASSASVARVDTRYCRAMQDTADTSAAC